MPSMPSMPKIKIPQLVNHPDKRRIKDKLRGMFTTDKPVNKFLEIIDKILDSKSINNNNIINFKSKENNELSMHESLGRGANSEIYKFNNKIALKEIAYKNNLNLKKYFIEIYIYFYLMIYDFNFIPKIYNFFIYDQKIIYSMDLIEGKKFNVIDINYNAFLNYMIIICDQLFQLQEKKFIHGDFKFDNIIIDNININSNKIYFIDFGCSSITRYDGKQVEIEDKYWIENEYHLSLDKHQKLKALDLLFLFFSFYDLLVFESISRQNRGLPQFSNNQSKIMDFIKNKYIFDIQEIYRICDLINKDNKDKIAPIIIMYPLLRIICLDIPEIKYVCLGRKLNIMLDGNRIIYFIRNDKLDFNKRLYEFFYDKSKIANFYPKKFKSNIPHITTENTVL